MTLTQRIGDTVTHRIPLRWGNAAFVPGNGWNLIFTVKDDPDTQDDENALFQKQYGVGITATGSTATVALIHEDTAGGIINEGEEDEATLEPLAPGTYYWDIQAQRLAEPYDVRTVADGSLVLKRDVTRGTTPSLPIYTTSPAEPIQVPVAGPQGATGPKGDKGDTGDPGPPGSGTITISDTAPENPADGQGWVESSTGILSFWSNADDAWIVPTTNPLPDGVFISPSGSPYYSPTGEYYTAPAA